MPRKDIIGKHGLRIGYYKYNQEHKGKLNIMKGEIKSKNNAKKH